MAADNLNAFGTFEKNKMVIPPKKPDDYELSYEDFDDSAWADDAAEREVIDLDALDADIPGEVVGNPPAPPAPDQAAASLLETIDKLDTELAPAVDAAELPPAPPAQEAETRPVEESPAPSEAKPRKGPSARRAASITRTAATAPVETPPETVAAPGVEAPPEPAIEAAAEPATGPAPAAEITIEASAETAVEPAAEPAAAVGPEVPPEPVIPPEVYCALLPLPPELASQVLEVRKTGEIATMPPPGIVLAAHFRTTDRPAVEAALAKWARAHLPFQFETVGVLAKVTGAQQYIAAWTLEPEEEITEAQQALTRTLGDLILPLPDAVTTFAAYVPIGEQIAAGRYPQVIGQMQRDFEPFVWRANDLQLVRQGEKPGEWEMVKSFD